MARAHCRENKKKIEERKEGEREGEGTWSPFAAYYSLLTIAAQHSFILPIFPVVPFPLLFSSLPLSLSLPLFFLCCMEWGEMPWA